MHKSVQRLICMQAMLETSTDSIMGYLQVRHRHKLNMAADVFVKGSSKLPEMSEVVAWCAPAELRQCKANLWDICFCMGSKALGRALENILTPPQKTRLDSCLDGKGA